MHPSVVAATDKCCFYAHYLQDGWQ